MRLLNKFFSLPKTHQKLLFKAFSLVVLIRIGLWIFPFKLIQKIVNFIPISSNQLKKYSKNDIVWAIETASNYVVGTKLCLVKSLAAQVLLIRNNYKSNIQFGVTKDVKEKLEAHAWVECDKKIVIGKTNDFSRYTPLIKS